MPTTQTPFLVFSNIVLVTIIYFVLNPYIRNPLRGTQQRYKVAIILCFVFCLFSFWNTDWFHYQDAFPELKAGWKGHMEEVYVWIAQNLSPNYIVFRLVIWGSAFLLFWRTINILSISKNLALFCFGTIYIIWFSYARVSLAMALVFYGYALLNSCHRSSLITKIIAISAIGVSFFFHKTAFFAIGVAIVAGVMKKYPKKAVWLMLIVFPLIVIWAKTQLSSFLLVEFDSADGDLSSYMMAGQNYMDEVRRVSGIGALIQSFLELFPHYGIAYVSFRCLRSKEVHSIPNDVKAFMLLQIVIVVASSIFAFDLGMNTSTLYVRFLRFAAIPTTILMAYLYENKIDRVLTKRIIALATSGTIYAMLYSFYNSFM